MNDRPSPRVHVPACLSGRPSSRCGMSACAGLRELPTQARARFVEGWKANTYQAGDVLFYQENQPLGLYFVCSGSVALSRAESGGRQQIVSVAEAPNYVGVRALVARQPYDATAKVLEDSRVCFMDAARFERFFNEEPGVARMMARMLAERGLELAALSAELGLRTVRERLSRLIVRGAERRDARGVADLGQTRLQLAERLGTSPEVVCRGLAELEDSGLVRVEGREARVLDARRLRAAAGLPAAAIDIYQARPCLRS